MFRKKLRPYQAEAFQRALPLGGFGLFGEQRTGKTPIALALIDAWKPDRLLIVTVPKGIVVWEKEFRESLEFDWPCEVRIIHYPSLRNRKEVRKLYRWLEQGERSMTIADEAHALKRRSSKQSKTVRNFGKRSLYRLALTGTPIAQGIHDAWALFNFIRPSAFGKWEAFERRYLKKGGFRGKQIIGHKNLKRFNKIFHRYSHRITLREARAQAGKKGLISRTTIRWIDLGPKARRIYDELDREMYSIINDEDEVTATLVITQAVKMHQLCGGFVIADSGTVRPVGREKLNELEKLCKTELAGKRYVVVARYVHELRAIRRLIERLGRTTQVIAGGTTFSGQLDADVGILQIASGSAIDLAAADSIIFFSWDYSYINLNQTKFRVLSFDTDRVTYYWLMVRNSIDEIIYRAGTSKEDLATLLLDTYRKRR